MPTMRHSTAMVSRFDRRLPNERVIGKDPNRAGWRLLDKLGCCRFILGVGKVLAARAARNAGPTRGG